MMICGVQHISKMFGGNCIFEDLSFEINEGDRVGLVGRNGGGKTTALKIIAGAEQADAGQVIFKKGTRVGYLAQIPTYAENMKAQDVLIEAFSEAKRIQGELRDLESAMAEAQNEQILPRLLEQYGTLSERFMMLDGYEMEAKVAKIANGLGITELLQTPFISLSGGEKTKVCLGLILLKSPDLLLLDEPTNHLDIAAVEWLERYLREYQGTVVIVSHDRYFLDEVVTKILDLEDGEVTIYHHNYSRFVVEKEKKLLDEFQSYQEQQKKIKKMREAIKRLREWANQASPPSEALHKRARNMERALERMEKLKRPIMERKTMGLQFEEANRSGKDVIAIEQVTKSFQDRLLFSEVNLHIQYKERVAIVGNNGTGKSTLLKMIQGEVEPDEGKVVVGGSVKIGYLSQHLYTSNVENTVLEAFREQVLVTEGDARHILAGFLFYGPAVFRKVTQLSGGERMRLRLAQLMHQEINLLILDEPTNHLDIDSCEVLEEALEDFQGTILAVSHDRYLLNKLFKKTYWIEAGTVHHFAGGYSWAREKLEQLREKRVEPEKIVKKVPVFKKVKEAAHVSYEQLEVEINDVENEIKKLNSVMENEKELDQLARVYEQRTALQLQLDILYGELEKML